MACWIFDTNIARIVLIRKLFPVILDDLSLKDLYFLRIELFSMKEFALSYYRFSYPIELTEEKKLSEKWSLVNRSLSPI